MPGGQADGDRGDLSLGELEQLITMYEQLLAKYLDTLAHLDPEKDLSQDEFVSLLTQAEQLQLRLDRWLELREQEVPRTQSDAG
jgi:hypothetical protein